MSFQGRLTRKTKWLFRIRFSVVKLRHYSDIRRASWRTVCIFLVKHFVKKKPSLLTKSNVRVKIDCWQLFSPTLQGCLSICSRSEVLTTDRTCQWEIYTLKRYIVLCPVLEINKYNEALGKLEVWSYQRSFDNGNGKLPNWGQVSIFFVLRHAEEGKMMRSLKYNDTNWQTFAHLRGASPKLTSWSIHQKVWYSCILRFFGNIIYDYKIVAVCFQW